MLVNTTTVVDRGNRPNISQRVGLRTYFINDGVYVDPYEISSVQLFAKDATLSPNTVVEAASGLVSGTPLMTFGASAQNSIGPTAPTVHCTRPVGALGNCADSFDPSNYTPGTTASGIYRIDQGQYVVVLDQIEALSGWDYTTATLVAASDCGTVGDYVDLWTVKLDSASKYQVITNNFSLHEDTFFAFTEPLLLTTSNRLMNKHVRYGEIIDLKVSTETTLQNKNMAESIQNIFKDSVVTAAQITIKKVNHDAAFDTHTVVPGAVMEITSDNTLIYTWDTNGIQISAAFGSPTGTYSVQVEYTALNQTIISPLFYLTVS